MYINKFLLVQNLKKIYSLHNSNLIVETFRKTIAFNMDVSFPDF